MTEQGEHNLGSFLTPQGLNVITAAIVRESLNKHDDEAFKEGFGMVKAHACRILRAWEICRLPEWNDELLQSIIPTKAFPNREVLAAHIRQQLPTSFSPLVGIEWAERAGYLTCFSVERKWAEWYSPAPGGVPVEATNAATANQAATDEPRGKTPTAADDWKEDARRIADEIDATDAKVGAYDSVKNIAERVAKQMRERGIRGPRGPLSGGSVLRDALQGGRWKRKQ